MSRRFLSSLPLVGEAFNWTNLISGGIVLAAGTSLYSLGNVHGETNSRLKNVEGKIETVSTEVSKTNKNLNEVVINQKILGEKIDVRKNN